MNWNYFFNLIMRIKKFLKKLNFLYWNNSIKDLYINNNKVIVEEVSLYEYKKLYEKLNFSNISHIQTPGYYINKNDSYYLKLYNNKNIYGLVSLAKKTFCLGLINFIRINDGPLICEEYLKYKYLLFNQLIGFIKKSTQN